MVAVASGDAAVLGGCDERRRVGVARPAPAVFMSSASGELSIIKCARVGKLALVLGKATGWACAAVLLLLLLAADDDRSLSLLGGDVVVDDADC